MNYPKWNSSNRSTNQSHLSLQLTVPFIYFTCLQLNDSWLSYSICSLLLLSILFHFSIFIYSSRSIWPATSYLHPSKFFHPVTKAHADIKTRSIPRRKISTCVLLLEEITLQKSLHRSLPPNGLIPEKSRHGINPEPGVFVLRVSFKIMITDPVYW